jgi:hypothetical protein
MHSNASGDSPGKRFAIALRTKPGPPGPSSRTMPVTELTQTAAGGYGEQRVASVTLRGVAAAPQGAECFPNETAAAIRH